MGQAKEQKWVSFLPVITDTAYFWLQYEIAKMLHEHKLFMQAYTVMRELIVSIGMIEVEKATSPQLKEEAKENNMQKFFLK